MCIKTEIYIYCKSVVLYANLTHNNYCLITEYVDKEECFQISYEEIKTIKK